MVNEQQQTENRSRLNSIMLLALAASVWDTLGRTGFAFSAPIGNHALWLMEREMGLEIIGDSPRDILMDICRVFINEFGFASEIEVTSENEGHFQIKVRDYTNLYFLDLLIKTGVKDPFVDPIMNACQAMLRQMGYKMHQRIEKWEEGNGVIITYTEV